jgi:atypical dual specificity phosphatase
MNWEWVRARIVYIPTLVWNLLLGRWLRTRDWWNRIDKQVILGALPFSWDIPKLSAEGVRAVVNTCQEYRGPVEKYLEYGIQQLRIPTIDFTHPSLEDIERAVEFMNRQIADGKTVYVHCKAGRARSATVVVCWLIQNKQISAARAHQWVKRYRPQVNHHLAHRPVIREFERRHLTRKTANSQKMPSANR